MNTEISQVTSFGPKHARGTCKHCGAPAYKGSATSCGMNGKCLKNGGKAAPLKTDTADTAISAEELAGVDESRRTRVDAPRDYVAPAGSDAKSVRAAHLKSQLLNEANPVLLKGFTLIMRPLPAENFVTLENGNAVPTDLSAPILIADWEAGILAKAAVELEANPMIAGGKAMMAPIVPYAAGAAALGVVLLHCYNVIQVRNQILAQWNAQQSGAIPTGPVGVPNEPAAERPVAPMMTPRYGPDTLEQMIG